MAVADALYDVFAALNAHAPGVLPSAEIIEGLAAAIAANGGQQLNEAQVLAVVGTPPTFPTGLKRWAGSNLVGSEA